MQSIHSPTAQRGEGGAVRHQRGESGQRPLITPMRFLLMNPKVSRRIQLSDTYSLLLPLHYPILPADRYLLPFVSNAPCTKILRQRLRMTGPAGRLSRNADYKLRRQTPPQPSAAKPPSNLRTLRPIGPVNPKNLFPSKPITTNALTTHQPPLR